MLQYSQKNTYVGVSFFCKAFSSETLTEGLKLLYLLIKKRLQHRCFPMNIKKFLKARILKTSSNGCFCLTLMFYLPSFSIPIQMEALPVLVKFA